MKKIIFKDLPNKETPINSQNLNTMQNNIEAGINGVVESGSNAYGSWIKFSDGTMICCGERVMENISFTADGNIYSAYKYFEGYPQNFIAQPFVNVTAVGGDYDAMINGILSTDKDNLGTVYLGRANQISNINVPIHYIAIGRWK